ncbi:hypothetical protein PSEUDO8Z_60739 [Pseudomonas sp. 8Z]|nr:hypothetical protein PSEUDO8Z_60739 [Pseudomonas sp. 8Z]
MQQKPESQPKKPWFIFEQHDDQQGHPGWYPGYLRDPKWLYPSRGNQDSGMTMRRPRRWCPLTEGDQACKKA